MKKRAKRKAGEKEEAKTTQENNKSTSRPKRVKASKPESPDEFFEDKRNLKLLSMNGDEPVVAYIEHVCKEKKRLPGAEEDLWKAAFPVGTEWDQLDSVYQYNWNFSNLEDSFEEGGKLYGKKVYLFGSTEPQLVAFKDEHKIICIPVVVAVVSPFPPSDKIGINSVQREAEEIVPMKQMKMDWVPYIPLENRDSQVDRLKSQIFILSCTQRRAALRHLKIDRVKKYEYCLPYIYQPFKEDELEQSTEVPIIYPAEPKPIFCEFDWELDEIEEFTDKLIEEEELSKDEKEPFKEFVKEKVREAKKANREAKEAKRKALEEMSEETKAAHESMKFYKFYPVQTPDTPDISNVKAPFINRYYGKAHEIL